MAPTIGAAMYSQSEDKKKRQIVNGAQTLGALKRAGPDKVADALVLVKLTAVKHAQRETGIAATLIKTNNTQNTLRIPDFRSNDKIQLWLETKFKNAARVAAPRCRPHPVFACVIDLITRS